MKKKVRVAALSVVLLAVAVSAYRLWEIYAGYHQADQVYQDTAAQVIHTESAGAPEDAPTWPGEKPKRTAPISVDFAALQQENPDVVGWIYCPGTVIQYPVVQGEDNEHYLSRMIDGTYNSAGTIFLDCRCDGSFQSSNSILYGHNMQDDSMFGTLEYYEEQAYFAAHPVLYLLTPEVDYEVQLLAGLHVPLDDEIYETDWTEWDLQDYWRQLHRCRAHPDAVHLWRRLPGHPLCSHWRYDRAGPARNAASGGRVKGFSKVRQQCVPVPPVV